MKKIFFISFYLMFLTCIYAQNKSVDQIKSVAEFLKHSEIKPWKSTKTKYGKHLKYRNLVLFDSIKTREMRISLYLDTSNTELILNQIIDPNNFIQWNSHIKKSIILNKGKQHWVLYNVYDIPFPLSSQDLITQNFLKKDKDSICVQSYASPRYSPEIKGIKRLKKQWTSWYIIPKSEKSTQLVFSAISLSNSSIPKALKDPMIQRKLFNAFTKLKFKFSK